MMALAKYIPKDQFDLTICSLRQNGYEETKPLLEGLGVTLCFARFRQKPTSGQAIIRWWRESKQLEAFGPFDVQHSMDFSAVPMEALFAKIHKRPYIYTQRNMNHGWLQKSKTILADHIICISDAVEMMLRQKLHVPKRKICKIYNGIDLDDLSAQLAPNCKRKPGYILCVGHIRPLKRHKDAIKALDLLKDDFPQVVLAIAGAVYDESCYRSLRQLVDSLQLNDRVQFLGLRQDVPQLMQQAEALIHCSETDALPLTLLEAMTIGVPVVASEVDGNKELIVDGKSGFLVPLGNIDGYANALRNLMTNADLSQSFAAEARNTIEKKHTASRVVQQTASVYLEAAERA